MLTDQLRSRIESSGPLTFAEFMEAALYDPEEGFYARDSVGEQREFVTSPHVSPLFGALVATQVEEFWALLGRPNPFSIVELGAGDGTLARQILDNLPSQVLEAARCTAVERSSRAREAIRGLGITAVASLDELESGPAGCILANELFDNIPFHRVRRAADGPRELYVGLDGDRFVLIEGEVSSEKVERLARKLTQGEEAVVNPGALDLLDRAAAALARGYVWLADYGWGSGLGEAGTVHGYRRQRLVEDILRDPGSLDITVGVDFDALAAHARETGWSVWGPVTQRDALLALGFRDRDEQARHRQVEALDTQRGIEAARIYSERNRASLLLKEGGLGDFLILCLGLGVERPPMSVRIS
jgi:SAM-dependent MidA family methyltransferase